MQIPKVQKDSQFKQLFALWGFAGVKAASKYVGEIDPCRHRRLPFLVEVITYSIIPAGLT